MAAPNLAAAAMLEGMSKAVGVQQMGAGCNSASVFSWSAPVACHVTLPSSMALPQ